MDVKKHIIIGFLVFLLLAITILFSMHSKKTSSLKISELIENENINDISLTIYYLSPAGLIVPPYSVDDLIDRSDVKKFVITGNDLEEHIDLFKQINNDVLIPVKKKSSDLDIRVYYVLESKKNGKLFDVAMWGDEESIFVNEFEVKENNIFYDVLIPFLPKDKAKELSIAVLKD